MTRRVHHEPRRATTATVPNVHPAHMRGRREWEQVYAFAVATAGLILTAVMLAYGLWLYR